MIHATFCEEMELQLFPFDVQNLSLHFESRRPSYALNFAPMVACFT